MSLRNSYADQFIEHAPAWLSGGEPIEYIRARISMWVLAALMKHPSFAEEKEWRMYVGIAKPEAIRFRQARLGLTPYEIPLTDEIMTRLEVVVGPCAYPANAAIAASMMLDHRDKSPRVTSPEIPFRDW